MKKIDKISRKSLSMPDSLWIEVDQFRFDGRIGTEAEAIRQLIQRGLKYKERRNVK